MKRRFKKSYLETVLLWENSRRQIDSDIIIKAFLSMRIHPLATKTFKLINK